MFKKCIQLKSCTFTTYGKLESNLIEAGLTLFAGRIILPLHMVSSVLLGKEITMKGVINTISKWRYVLLGVAVTQAASIVFQVEMYPRQVQITAIVIVLCLFLFIFLDMRHASITEEKLNLRILFLLKQAREEQESSEQ